MDIVAYTEVTASDWDLFVQEHNYGWFWYTTLWMKYSEISQFGTRSQNKSFCVRDGRNKIVAVVPLLIEKKNEDVSHNEIVFGGLPTPAPLVDFTFKKKKIFQIYREIFSHIDSISCEYSVSKATFRSYDPYLYFINRYLPYNFLMKFGYSDTTINTQVIDLRVGEKEILSGFANETKRLLRKSEGLLSFQVYNSNNILLNDFNTFRDFYFDVAGKVTRPQNAFALLFQNIIDGNASLLFACFEEKIVGVQYVIHYKKGAYYLMSAADRVFNKCSVGHLLQHETIKYLCDLGISYYEVGWQQYADTLFDFPSDKDKNISFFKRSFGGIEAPLFTGEKFYSESFFRETIKNRMEIFAKNNFNRSAS
ncbi:MAG: GNAT family N-acetyltransferase [Desulfobulbaceae bacterium]|nr:GNAT family N-acetyltransferase [Desulfobulbaceae bacterium]